MLPSHLGHDAFTFRWFCGSFSFLSLVLYYQNLACSVGCIHAVFCLHLTVNEIAYILVVLSVEKKDCVRRGPESGNRATTHTQSSLMHSVFLKKTEMQATASGFSCAFHIVYDKLRVEVRLWL